MRSGRVLTSPADIGDAIKKLNVIYWIGGIAGFVFGIKAGMGVACIFAGFGLVFAYAIVESLAKGKSYALRTIEFAMPENKSIDDLFLLLPPVLGARNIQTFHNGDSLVFKSGSTQYDFTCDMDKKTFQLWWHFSFAKAFFSFKVIGDCRRVHEETGFIAYTIQQTEKKTLD